MGNNYKPSANRQYTKLTQEAFLVRCQEIHTGKGYDYSRVIYTACKNDVVIGCPVHGWFTQNAANHLFGAGCYRCRLVVNRLTQEEFIAACKAKHGSSLNFDHTVFVNTRTKVRVDCPTHGEYWQKASQITVRGCPTCGKSSQGEKLIAAWLTENKLAFKKEKTFSGLLGSGGRLLRFDFYVPRLDWLIEYDGSQHFIEEDFNSLSRHKAPGGFYELQQNDKLKTEFARNEGFRLTRIPYTKKSNIPSILLNARFWDHQRIPANPKYYLYNARPGTLPPFANSGLAA